MSAFQNLTIAEKIVLAIDVADEKEAERLVAVAKDCGARFIKFGLELATAKSWAWCAELADKNGLEWISDAKFDDIPNTVAGGIRSMKHLALPPKAITIHASIGSEGMELAQKTAGDIKILAVTVLTSLSDNQAQEIYGAEVANKVMQLAEMAADAGLEGLVCSPLEVKAIKSNPKTRDLLAMIPGSRSAGSQSADQARTATPAAAIASGADLLVIGREISQAEDPVEAYAKIIKDIEEA